MAFSPPIDQLQNCAIIFRRVKIGTEKEAMEKLYALLCIYGPSERRIVIGEPPLPALDLSAVSGQRWGLEFWNDERLRIGLECELLPAM